MAGVSTDDSARAGGEFDRRGEPPRADGSTGAGSSAQVNPIVGRGAELERTLPFGIWVDALDEQAAALGHERLERLVGDCTGELARVLPSAGDGSTQPDGLQDERFRAYRAVGVTRISFAECGSTIKVQAVGDDADKALDAICGLVAEGFNE